MIIFSFRNSLLTGFLNRYFFIYPKQVQDFSTAEVEQVLCPEDDNKAGWYCTSKLYGVHSLYLGCFLVSGQVHKCMYMDRLVTFCIFDEVKASFVIQLK